MEIIPVANSVHGQRWTRSKRHWVLTAKGCLRRHCAAEARNYRDGGQVAKCCIPDLGEEAREKWTNSNIAISTYAFKITVISSPRKSPFGLMMEASGALETAGQYVYYFHKVIFSLRHAAYRMGRASFSCWPCNSLRTYLNDRNGEPPVAGLRRAPPLVGKGSTDASRR